MSGHVVDKFRPVSTQARTHTSPVRVLVGLWLLALCMGLYASEGLVRQLGMAEDVTWTHSLLGPAEAVRDGADAIGLLTLRGDVDGLVDPFMHSTKLFKKPRVVPALGEATLTAEAPVDDKSLPPGVTYMHPAGPGAQRARRVLLVGASSVQYYLGIELERQLEGYASVQVERVGKLGTGLNRDDVFDWPATLAELMEEHRPDVVIAQFGGNDAQPIRADGKRVSFGKPEWATEYQRRLEALTRQIARAGALPIFLGMPVMKEPGFSGRVERLNGITDEAVRRAGGRYIDTWSLASTPEGAYLSAATYQGKNMRMRLADGVHFTKHGAAYLTAGLLPRLERAFPLVRDAPAHAVAVHLEVPSRARGKTSPAVAFVPRDVPPEGLPVLFLLHGAWDGWGVWSDRAHAELQRLSTQHGLIIVLPDGEPFGWYVDSPLVPQHQIATYMLDELVPFVDEHLPSNGRRAIMGNSMGGHGAINLALDRPELFESVSSLSGAVDLVFAKQRTQLQELLGPYEQQPERWEQRSALHRLRALDGPMGFELLLDCGTEDLWFDANSALHSALDERHVPHRWSAVEGEAHTWDYWVARLPEHVAFHADGLGAGD